MFRPAHLRSAGVCFVALATLLTLPGPALACSYQPNPLEFTTNGPPPAGAPAPLPPRLANVVVYRSQHAPPGIGDCAELGSVQLSFTLAGAAWPATLGIRLRLVDGFPPDFVHLDGPAWRVKSGKLSFVGGDDPSRDFEFTVQATTVDASDMESSPITIHVSSTSQAEGGCALAPRGRSSALVPLLLVGCLLIVRAKAGKCSTN
jgi:hypothetical protein